MIVSGSDNDRTIADANSFNVVLNGQKHSATILEKEKDFRRLLTTSGSDNYALNYGSAYYYIKFTPITFTVRGEMRSRLFYTENHPV